MENGYAARLTKQDVARAQLTLMKYRRGKRELEERIAQSEKWWRMRHWDCMEAKGNANDVRPRSGWLFHTVLSRHADGVQSLPEANILPREEGDRAAARALTQVIPCILDRNGFEQVYSDVLWQKLKQGTGIYGVYWDPEAGRGGDIAIRRADALSLFWEPGVKDVQDSENLFCVTCESPEALKKKYPFLTAADLTPQRDAPRLPYGSGADAEEKCAVVEWYYRRDAPGGKKLHYVKYTGNTILYSSENEGLGSWYAHGQYPFVFDPLFPVEGSPCGFGYIDVGKSAQEQIDLMQQAVLSNLLWSARPRYFARVDGAVNEQEFADWTRTLVHTDAGLGAESLRCVDTPPLPAGALAALEGRIAELKQVTGDTDSSNGIAAGSNQAASAIAALQEASGKTSRAATQSAYRAFAKVVGLVISLIRQFYDRPRLFRIAGAGADFMEFDPLLLRADEPPEFDVRVCPQTRSQYTKNLMNEWAVTLYKLGVFDPGNERRALPLLEMMDFEGRDRLMRMLDERAAREEAALPPDPVPEGVAMPAGDPLDGARLAEALRSVPAM